MTVPETARLLRVNADTVRRWLRTGRLRGVKIGHVYRVPESALTDLTEPDKGSAAQPRPAELVREENARHMERTLALLAELEPAMRAGTLRQIDVAEEIEVMREERDRDILGY